MMAKYFRGCELYVPGHCNRPKLVQSHVQKTTQREETLGERMEEQRERMAIDPDNEDAKAEFIIHCLCLIL